MEDGSVRSGQFREQRQKIASGFLSRYYTGNQLIAVMRLLRILGHDLPDFFGPS